MSLSAQMPCAWSTDQVRKTVQTCGQVGIGTTTPQQVMHVFSADDFAIIVEAQDSNAIGVTGAQRQARADQHLRPSQSPATLPAVMKLQPIDVGGAKIHRPGTVVGKALQALSSGRGEILVLLSLQ